MTEVDPRSTLENEFYPYEKDKKGGNLGGGGGSEIAYSSSLRWGVKEDW